MDKANARVMGDALRPVRQVRASSDFRHPPHGYRVQPPRKVRPGCPHIPAGRRSFLLFFFITNNFLFRFVKKKPHSLTVIQKNMGALPHPRRCKCPAAGIAAVRISKMAAGRWVHPWGAPPAGRKPLGAAHLANAGAFRTPASRPWADACAQVQSGATAKDQPPRPTSRRRGAPRWRQRGSRATMLICRIDARRQSQAQEGQPPCGCLHSPAGLPHCSSFFPSLRNLLWLV